MDEEWSPNNEREAREHEAGENVEPREHEAGEKLQAFRNWAERKYSRKRLSFWEYTIFLAMSLLFLVLAYSLANMLHSLYSEYILKGKPVVFRHYFLMCFFLLLVFFALDRYFFRFSVLPY